MLCKLLPKPSNLRLGFLCFYLGVCGVLMGCGASDQLAFSKARVRAPVPGTDKAVGYFVVANHTGGAVVLENISSTEIRGIEIHETLEVDGLLRMRRLIQPQLGDGETWLFEPGGKHLMLFGVSRLSAAPRFTFHFRDLPPVEVEFEIQPLLGEG
jgi:copper(I)-binding protein